MKSMKFLFVFIGVGLIFYGVNHCSDDEKKPCANFSDTTSVAKDALK